MTTATGMGPLPELVEEMAGIRGLVRIFEQQSLPLALVDNRQMRMPLSALIDLFEGAAPSVGDRTFGLRLLDGDTDIDGAALLAGLGPRSLQKKLRDEGFTYRKILDAVRLQRSAALLQETDETVTYIALSLGYAEPGNFTRAFHRWTGRSPIDFRHRAAKVGGALAMQNLLVAYPNNLNL
jgi:AraC-like DNA-binding protein